MLLMVGHRPSPHHCVGGHRAGAGRKQVGSGVMRGASQWEGHDSLVEACVTSSWLVGLLQMM